VSEFIDNAFSDSSQEAGSPVLSFDDGPHIPNERAVTAIISLLMWMEIALRAVVEGVTHFKESTKDGLDTVYEAVVPAALRTELDGLIGSNHFVGYLLLMVIVAFLLHPEGLFIQLVSPVFSYVLSFRDGSVIRDILVFSVPVWVLVASYYTSGFLGRMISVFFRTIWGLLIRVKRLFMETFFLMDADSSNKNSKKGHPPKLCRLFINLSKASLTMNK